MDNIEKERPETGSYAYKLLLSDFLRERLMWSVIQTLKIPMGSRVLDIGCGIGSHTLMLAETVGREGHVTGLDLSRDLLHHAKQRTGKSGQWTNVTFQQGDMNRIPFDNDAFDWAWSVDCAGYAPGEPLSLINEIKRVVKPGGVIAILAWSSQQLLPGYPLLEARLNATSFGIAPFSKGKGPEAHFVRTLGRFQEAGLEECKARTFVDDVFAPLNKDVRNALISLFEMRWGDPRSELTQEDRTEYERLCQPESPDFILDSPDYYAFFTYTLFRGKVAK